ncbi:MAG TPA: FHA domain-containing protein, partial [Kiloniellales bacterium]|nr:FHA domain-containing protein [Kiloniellales bacterium]
MAIRITHLDGPLAGQVQQFGNDKERIQIGRVAEDTDVRYPDDYTAVSREHVVLVQGPGIYRLDLSTDKPVFINGREALQDEELKGTVEMQLGGADGPRLRLEVNPGLTGPTTVKRTAMESTATRLRGTRRVTAYIGAAVVAVIVAVVVIWVILQQRTVDLRAFVEEQASKQRQAAGAVSPEILQKARDSVYLVVEADASGEMGQGTAWVVG